MSASAVDRALLALAPPGGGNLVNPTVSAALPRFLLGVALVLVSAWVLGPLGGLGSQPRVTEPAGSNDTSPLFNWHPLLMVAALAAWAEGALQFRSPLGTSLGLSPTPPPRPARKAAHALLHSLATVAAGGGLSAAWLSHSRKLPSPIPHFYSPHAALGLCAATLLFSQFALGFAAFLWPRGAPAARDGFRRTHASLGAASLALGAGAAFAGFAEKAAFSVVGAKAPARSSAVALPAAAAVFLAAGVGSTLGHLLVPKGKPSLDGISSNSVGGGGGGGGGEGGDEF